QGILVLPGVDQRFEIRRVDPGIIDVERVGGAHGAHSGCTEHLAQLTHVLLQRLGRRRRRLARPYVLDELTARDGVGARDDEPSEYRALAGSAEAQRTTVVLHLDGAEDLELHEPPTSAGARCGGCPPPSHLFGTGC